MTFDEKQLRADVAGFSGRFEAREENEHEADRLVFVPADNAFEDGDPDGEYMISDALEFHVGEPIARILNAAPAALDEIVRLRGLLREAGAMLGDAVALRDDAENWFPAVDRFLAASKEISK